MSIARYSIDRPLTIWLFMLSLLFGGLWAYLTLGRLEDPAFTIKTAVVITQYPGASAEQVASEVTEPLESVIQKMGEVDQITSINQPGLSQITVDMKDTYDGADLPQIWTKLRNRVAEARLPKGATAPYVNDAFGDVFGLYYAVVAPGLSNEDIYNLSQFVRRELLTVEGVANVDLGAVPNEVIYVEPDMALAASQNIPPQLIQQSIASANDINNAGKLNSQASRVLIQGAEGDDSVEEIAGLSVGVNGQVVRLSSFADVYRAEETNPSFMVRYNGQKAFTLGVAGISDQNIVDIGYRVDEKFAELTALVPYGVEMHPIYQQHIVVDEASQSFLVNLATSVSIVVLVLALAMGWRAAVVVGATLFLTVVGTVFAMGMFSIEMERISLGALIIAMGMLVDNAIVVAEGMQMAMARGMSSRDAAEQTAKRTQIPLLGATVIGIMAFAGIGLSSDATGEFLFSLFAVIAISLVLSWILALMVTPLLGHYLFVQGTGENDGDQYEGLMYRAYGGVLRLCLRAWWAVIPGLIAITVVCVMLFGSIKQQFFPDSNTPLLFVHYQLPQGASIHQTSQDMVEFETWLAARSEVVSVSTFIGQGAARFMLTYDGQRSNPSYGHLIIRTQSLDDIEPLRADLVEFAASQVPFGQFRAKRLAFGPSGGSPIQVRLSGSDPDVLRDLADEARAILHQTSDDITLTWLDWREREQVMRPVYATQRAQAAGITRDVIADAFLFATDGIQTGVYREQERQIPIVLKMPSAHAQQSLLDQQVYSSSTNQSLPLGQVIDGTRFEAQDTLMMRRDRVYTITVEAEIAAGLTAAYVQNQVQDAIDAMQVPQGYKMAWGGEYESSSDAQSSLAKTLPISFVVMVLISILLFDALRQPLIIWLLVPMSINGVTFALLGAGAPFSFTALLGLLSLSGMLIKNGVVLVDEIDQTRADQPHLGLADAITLASTSRIRPVFLAAATTILGMIPLIWDAFFVSMALTIMGGLAFASVLTLIAAPVLYFVFFGRGRHDVQTRTAAGQDPVSA